jgi:hypothetical protein
MFESGVRDEIGCVGKRDAIVVILAGLSLVCH